MADKIKRGLYVDTYTRTTDQYGQVNVPSTGSICAWVTNVYNGIVVASNNIFKVFGIAESGTTGNTLSMVTNKEITLKVLRGGGKALYHKALRTLAPSERWCVA